MSSDRKGTKTSAFPAARGLSAIPSGHRPHKLQSQIDAKRATAREMRLELERISTELRSAMYVVESTDANFDDEVPEHPQIKQRALLMVRVALEDAIASLDAEADELEATALENPL